MSVEFKYYFVLGVPRNASGDAIKKALRKLARKHHPDVSKDKKGAEEKLKELNEANEVLGDPDKRRKYDELGAEWNQAERQPSPAHAARPGQETGSGFDFEGTGFSVFGTRSQAANGIDGPGNGASDSASRSGAGTSRAIF